MSGTKIRRMTRRCHPVGGGPVKPMAFADGYVMARRPGCIPFIVAESEWLTWPKFEDAAAAAGNASNVTEFNVPDLSKSPVG
jgi:hypothetical protein